ncbi:MAG TPA: hypothetical protein VGA66_13800 [Mycobacterium sp.]
MIKYAWRSTLSDQESAQLDNLLGRAAAYDAEPEYSTIDFADVARSMSTRDPTARHLVIWMLPYATAIGQPDHPESIAGLLRMTFTSASAAEAAVVIDPRLRSLGIMTALLESVGLDTAAPEGWLGSGAHSITAWARGNHPASGRLSNRFLIPRTRLVWKLIRGTDYYGTAAAPVLEVIEDPALRDLGWAGPWQGGGTPHALRESGRIVGVTALDLRPIESIEFGWCATVTHAIAAPTADLSARRRLLEGAAAAAREAGMSGVIIHVAADDAGLVNACRLTGFQHERTDVRYHLGKD